MINKAKEMVRSFACRTKKAVIASWESRLPYRLSLLMSSCDSSEKGMRILPNISFETDDFAAAQFQR